MTVVTVMGQSINPLVRDDAVLLSQADHMILIFPFSFLRGWGGGGGKEIIFFKNVCLSSTYNF